MMIGPLLKPIGSRLAGCGYDGFRQVEKSQDRRISPCPTMSQTTSSPAMNCGLDWKVTSAGSVPSKALVVNMCRQVLAALRSMYEEYRQDKYEAAGRHLLILTVLGTLVGTLGKFLELFG